MTDSFKPLPGNEISKKNSSTSPQRGNVRRVLGIDPGLASTGWAIVDFCNNRYACVDYGVIETKNDRCQGERLRIIYTELEKCIKTYSPNEAAMETLYFAKNITSAMGVAEARGVIQLCFAHHNLVCGEYTPLIIKKTITGTNKAEKKTVQEYLKLLLGLSEIIKPDHASDAVACAITHLHSGFTIK